MLGNNTFPGFPRGLFRCMRELFENNNRDWFNEHEDRYHALVADPVCDFVDAMRPRLRKISTHYVVDSRPHGGCMFPIYRDKRYSKDKRLYKENVACQFHEESGS
jgi:uncharacterized protein (TIGR02453 family)